MALLSQGRWPRLRVDLPQVPRGRSWGRKALQRRASLEVPRLVETGFLAGAAARVVVHRPGRLEAGPFCVEWQGLRVRAHRAETRAPAPVVLPPTRPRQRPLVAGPPQFVGNASGSVSLGHLPPGPCPPRSGRSLSCQLQSRFSPGGC